MNTFTKAIGMAVLVSSLLASLPASAATTTYFRDADRTVLKSYVTTSESTPSSSSTTTTTKTTTTYYEPGSIIPETVTYTELPTTVVSNLAAPPEGDVYVTVGNHAYLIDRDRRVVDAIKIVD